MTDQDDLLSKEQALLETFFYSLGQFLYDKAKEIVEKERDTIIKTHQGTSFFVSVLTALSQLAVAEKSYTSVLFLGPKGFLRKDNSLKSLYEALRHDLHRLEERSNNAATPASSPTLSPTPLSATPSPPTHTPIGSSILSGSGTPGSVTSSLSLGGSLWGQIVNVPVLSQGSEMVEKLAGHLCGQLYYFASARLETMELYEKMYSMSTMRFMKTKELFTGITEIITNNQKHFHHPLLIPLKSAFSSECEVLQQLLEAQMSLLQWKFLPSLLHLHEAHSKLSAWAMPATSKDGKRVSIHPSLLCPPLVPPLYQWLCKVKAALVSKFTLYFHEILNKQTTPQEMKNICSRASIDYYHKMVNFHRKSDALFIALVLDTHGLDEYKGHGYSHPERYHEPPEGLDSYPAVVSYPQEKPLSHWPSVIMIMTNKAELKNTDNIVCFYDPQVQTTYFLSRIEPRMTLVIIYEGRKSDRDSYITGFMHDLCSHLRCNKVFASLKPGSK